MTTLNNHQSRLIRRITSAQNLPDRSKSKTPKSSSHRSLSLSSPSECSTDHSISTPKTPQKSSNILHLESILLSQSQQLTSLHTQQQKLYKTLEDLSCQEQKIQKKQNLLSFKNTSEDSKQRFLKQKSEDLSKQSESLLKTLENISKIDKSPDPKFKENSLLSQLDRDVKVNKEMRLLLKVLKYKLSYAKTKSKIKKQLREKQNQQIQAMKKIVQFLLNQVETGQDSALRASCKVNKSRGLNFVSSSVCDAKDYWKSKERIVSEQIIEEKRELEIFQNLSRKERENKGVELIKNKNLTVLQGLGVGKEDEDREKVLRNKREVLENLQAMLKFWIQEYSNVSSFMYSEEEELENY